MKRTIIHLLFLMTLASSFPAFAVPNKDKDKDKDGTKIASTTKTPCPSASRDNSEDYYQDKTLSDADKAQSGGDPEKSRQQMIKDQEKQWLRDVDYAR